MTNGLYRFEITENCVYDGDCELEIFRAPTDMGTSGTLDRLMKKITWEDIVVGDILMVQMKNESVICRFEFWRVLSKNENNEIVADVNCLVGMAQSGQQIYNNLNDIVTGNIEKDFSA